MSLPKIEKFSIVRECIGCYNRNPLDCLCGCLLHKVRIRRHVREVCLYRVCWHRLPAGIHLSDIFPVKRKIVAGSHEAQNGDSGYIFEYITMFHNYCFF